MSIVTKEEFDAAVAAMHRESPDQVLVLTSPAADVRRTEELLGIKEGTMPNTILKFAKGEECCPNCHRNFNVLDLIKSALEVHSKEFLTGKIFGNDYVMTDYVDAKEKAPTCYDCDTKGIGAGGYNCQRYVCIK